MFDFIFFTARDISSLFSPCHKFYQATQFNCSIKLYMLKICFWRTRHTHALQQSNLNSGDPAITLENGSNQASQSLSIS